MKITIITATFNSAKTVNDTCASVAAQDYPEVEHIIIDGSSTDDTLNIVRGFSHIHGIYSEPDRGIYDAMNKGIGKASGDIIGILNSDDLYANRNVLAKVVSIFSDPTVQAVYGDLQYVQQNNTNKVVRYWRSGVFTTRKFYMGWMPPHPTFFVRRSVYEQAGLFDLSLRSSADYEIMLRILLRFKMEVRYIPEVLVKMRTGGLSNASLRNRFKANHEDRIAWRINNLNPYFFTTYLKPIRKIFQFINR